MRMMRYGVLMLCFFVSGAITTAQEPRHDDPEYTAYRGAITEQVAAMSLRQKVAQMFMVGLYGPNITVEGQAFLQTYQPGGIVIFAYNAASPSSLTQLVNDWQTAITASGAPPMLVAIDQEGGRINTLEEPPFTQFPVPALITAASNHNLTYRTAAAQSQELKAVGVHMNLAPVVDLETNPNNPVIFRRAYGSDPQIVAPVIAATVQGMQDNGVIATLKHFPGHGDTDEDSHLELPILPYNLDALRSLELLPFEAGIRANAEAIMVGHLWLPQLEPTPYLPASLSYNIVTGLLREEMGYDGIIMTDALDMDAIDTVYSLPEASVMAIQAGVDLIATGPHVGINTLAASIDAVVAAVEAGDIANATINASVYRIMDVKHRYHILNWEPLDPNTTTERVLAAGSESVINELFAAGVTLVYDTYQALPLPADNSVVLVYPAQRPTIYNACARVNPTIQRIGYSNYPTSLEIDEATRLATTASYVIVFTQNAIDKPEQAALINALPSEKTVVVAYWSPYDINAFARQPAAYLTTYSPNNMGFTVACGILFGATPARGKLPMNLSTTLLAASGTGLPVR